MQTLLKDPVIQQTRYNCIWCIYYCMYMYIRSLSICKFIVRVNRMIKKP